LKFFFVFIYCTEQLNLKNISYWHYFTTKIILICPIWNFTLSVTQIFIFLKITHLWHQWVFFRHDIYNDDIPVFQTWNLHRWHQCFWDMTYILMTSVYFTWHLLLWHQCFSDMTYTFMTSVYFTWHLHLRQCFSDMTYTLMTSVYFTWHLHLWHQCFSDMTSTLITSVSVFGKSCPSAKMWPSGRI
jgi:hypothetical protein